MDFKIILYYKYTNIDTPESFMPEHKKLCEELDLKGRIIIAKEGINGTLEGTTANIDSYVTALKSDTRFKDTHIKYSEGTGSSFPKLSVKVRPEIVSAHLDKDDVNPTEFTAKHITAQELHELIHSDAELYIIDMRNDYEHVVGHFKNSILPNMRNFRDLPKILDDIKHLKDKKVITVCTGGIRCEKASGYLLKHGFSDVSQLYGGIVTYMETYPNENFLGDLYVFDNRVVMGFNTNSKEHITIGECEHCKTKSTNYINCAYDPCHKHFICCEKCIEKFEIPPVCIDCSNKNIHVKI